MPGLKYLVAGKEKAPTTGTPHLQIFLTLKSPTTFRALQKKVEKATGKKLSLRPVTKTPHLAARYCKKGTARSSKVRMVACPRVDGDWEEMGTPPPKGKGARTDLLALRDAVLAGKSRMEVLTSDETAAAAARYGAYHRELEAQRQQAQEMERLKQEMDGVVLRDWQERAVRDLDEYSLFLLTMNAALTCDLKGSASCTTSESGQLTPTSPA